MTFKQAIGSSQEMQRLAPWLSVGRPDIIETRNIDCKMGEEMGELNARAFNNIQTLMQNGTQCLFDLYSAQEMEQNPDKAQTQLLYIPGKPGMPFVISIPGGAYLYIAAYGEGVPVMQLLSESGYHAFTLVYRMGQENMMPKALDDLAAALRLIFSRADSLGIDPHGYAVMGFSAGGHLAGCWGSKNHGYAHYELPAPSALLLAYPAASLEAFCDDFAAGIGTPTYTSVGKQYLRYIGGKDYTRETLREYCVENQMDEKFPPTYIVHCKDDPAVHFHGSQRLVQKLEGLRVPCRFRQVDAGGHGFGPGLHIAARGWIIEALAFWQEARG